MKTPRKAKELGALAVGRLQSPGLHFVGGVAGLGLQILPTGGRTWILRATVGGRRRDMGLGGFPDVTLADAREAARKARDLIRNGVDPIEQAKAARSALKAEAAKAMTFRQACEAFLASHEAAWRNAKHRAQWTSTLQRYAYPVIGDLSVGDVELSHITKVLDPIWREKTETASRVRGRIEQVLDWAAVRGLRQDQNPARWKGLLDKVLPKPAKVTKAVHHRTLSYRELPDLMTRLGDLNGVGATALRFAILTAARSGEVRGALWSEIDLAQAIWTIPAHRMKASREHRVPLSTDTLALLEAQPRIAGSDLVFPAPRA